MLSMTTMGFGARAALPRVNYATAFDWFVILCFAFVFAVMVEYAAINFIDKVTVDLRRVLEERKNKKRSSTASAAVALAGSATAPCTPPSTAPGTPATPGRSRSPSREADAAVAAKAAVETPPAPPSSHPRVASGAATPSVVVTVDAVVEPLVRMALASRVNQSASRTSLLQVRRIRSDDSPEHGFGNDNAQGRSFR